jgi:hypothetical protein
MPTPFGPSFRTLGSKSGTETGRVRRAKEAVIKESSSGMGPRSGRPERRVRRLGSFLGFGALLALPLVPGHGCEMADSPVPETRVAPTPSPVPDSFATTVRPILRERCAPCHEPGGKMYERLPFDNPRTIASHPEGVLKRLKGDDREAVEKWLAGLPKTP